MWIKVFLMAAVVGLGGCATKERVTIQVQEVQVPIRVPCAVNKPIKPDYYFSHVTVSDDLLVKVKALVADISIREGYEAQMIAALEACTK